MCSSDFKKKIRKEILFLNHSDTAEKKNRNTTYLLVFVQRSAVHARVIELVALLKDVKQTTATNCYYINTC